MLWFALSYVVCSVMTYGMTFAYYQAVAPFSAEALTIPNRLAAYGPAGLIAALVLTDGGYHGMRFR